MKPRKPIRWFKVGRAIVCKGSDVNLFSLPPITIQSEQHAKAIHASQDKGYRYK